MIAPWPPSALTTPSNCANDNTPGRTETTQDRGGASSEAGNRDKGAMCAPQPPSYMSARRAPSYVILTAGWTCYRVVERDDFRFKRAASMHGTSRRVVRGQRTPGPRRPSGAFRAYLTV